jgi:hypothetical protein
MPADKTVIPAEDFKTGRQAAMLPGRKTDSKAGKQSVKRTDILSSGWRQTARQTEGLLGKQPDFQTGRRTFKQADRQTARYTDILPSWQKDFHAGRQTVMPANRF